ncbi:MAG: ATP-binding cassette domain-containing protein, partial [Stellaceae bacterium]
MSEAKAAVALRTPAADAASAQTRPIIAIHNVAVELSGARIYDAMSFTVSSGEFLCILGPSGCGKST